MIFIGSGSFLHSSFVGREQWLVHLEQLGWIYSVKFLKKWKKHQKRRNRRVSQGLNEKRWLSNWATWLTFLRSSSKCPINFHCHLHFTLIIRSHIAKKWEKAENHTVTINKYTGANLKSQFNELIMFECHYIPAFDWLNWGRSQLVSGSSNPLKILCFK